MKTQILLQKAITQFYSNDGCKPSVTSSYVGDEDDELPFYASVVRYPDGDFPRSREVVCYVRGKTATATVRELAKIWYERVCHDHDALDALAEHLTGMK